MGHDTGVISILTGHDLYTYQNAKRKSKCSALDIGRAHVMAHCDMSMTWLRPSPRSRSRRFHETGHAIGDVMTCFGLSAPPYPIVCLQIHAEIATKLAPSEGGHGTARSPRIWLVHGQNASLRYAGTPPQAVCGTGAAPAPSRHAVGSSVCPRCGYAGEDGQRFAVRPDPSDQFTEPPAYRCSPWRPTPASC